MRIITFILLTIFCFNCADAPDNKTNSPSKLKRKDCFFGVHFDIHAKESTMDAGKTLTYAMIDTFLTAVQPDYVQIDCKGHSGISSYPTKVGFPVSGFKKDPLKLWRKVTANQNVSLFMHFSGVYDRKVVQEHPDWAVVDAEGERSDRMTSFFSPYLDTYMIPQLKELSDYGVDGVWVDGECWAVHPDYGDASVDRFKKEYGIDDIPKDPSSENYDAFLEYTRMLFREHLNKYVDAIHAYDPAFQIASNWAYSSLMPEQVNSNVDFLSGDVTPFNGVYRSALEARCLAAHGKPWDLMSWGFSSTRLYEDMSRCMKSATQLKQEAAQIMAMGGGVQVYYKQNQDLSFNPQVAGTLAEIGDFCRKRQPYCHKATPVPQVGLIFPTKSYLKNAARPYNFDRDGLRGALNVVLDNQLPVEVLMEHHIAGKMNQYPLIVIPECDYFEPLFLKELKKYVNEGGNLLIIGIETAALFEEELGIKIKEEIATRQLYLNDEADLLTVYSPAVNVELLPGTVDLTHFFDKNDARFKSQYSSSTMNQYGKGKIIGIYFNGGIAYQKHRSFLLRDYFQHHIALLFTEPKVEVSGSRLVHLALNELNDRAYVNLINTAGEHTNDRAAAFDQVPPLIDISVAIRIDKKPTKILLQPDNKEIKFDYQHSVANLKLDKVEMHSILEVIFN